MSTENYNLPKITGNMTADVVRDVNVLADATDAAIKQAVDSVDLSTVEQEISDVSDALTSHLADEANPHNVDKEQVGLGNVDNVKQIPLAQKGKPLGVAALDDEGNVIDSLGNKVGDTLKNIVTIDLSQGVASGIYNLTDLSIYKRVVIMGKAIKSQAAGIEFIYNNITTDKVYMSRNYGNAVQREGSSILPFGNSTAAIYDFMLDIDCDHRNKSTQYYSNAYNEGSSFPLNNIGVAGFKSNVIGNFILDSIQIRSILYGGGNPPNMTDGRIEVWGEIR